MEAFKKQCIDLRKKGYSIIEIMKMTGRAKSSIHVHIRDIPLNEDRKKQIRAASGNRIRVFAIARKGKSIRPFQPFDDWSADTVLLIAHLLFDGEILRTRCVYNNRSEALIKCVEKLMHALYEFEPKRYLNQLTGVHRISYHNVTLGAYVEKKSVELLRTVKGMPLNLKREFVRAFFDDEGCIDYRPHESRRSVRGYQKDVRILKIIKILLADFNIVAKIVFPNEVVIVGKENLMRFEREINFSHGVFMNGNRSNSRWKKHMEKRDLLRQAIASFKS